MGWFDKFKRDNAVTVSNYRMVVDAGNGFYSWNGNLYQSDIVRACIRPKARAIGKAVAKHVRKTGSKLEINPDVFIRFLLEDPNPLMNGQQLQEKLITQLELNNNAFAYIAKDENGYPLAIYPIVAQAVEALQDSQQMYLRFMVNSKYYTFKYDDIIHLRKDFNGNDIFGESPAAALTSLMEIVSTTDQGIVAAVKNSAVIRWLLKFTSNTRPESLTAQAKEFAKNFMSTSSATGGVAAVNSSVDAQQVKSENYVPNSFQMSETVKRLMNFFNTNDKIVNSSYDENGWVSYYEAAVEPDIVQLSNEYTRKIFSRRERGFGNKIVFESSNLGFAAINTKLALQAMVDRGAMTPNEWRATFGYAPIDGGDEPIRRLDTRPTTEGVAK